MGVAKVWPVLQTSHSRRQCSGSASYRPLNRVSCSRTRHVRLDATRRQRAGAQARQRGRARSDGHGRPGALPAAPTSLTTQRFIALLASHPYFRLHALGASERSAGKPYGQVVRWRQTVRLPDAVANLVVQPCTPKAFADCPIVFSGLDADVAGEIESAFRAAELAVFSNAKNFRMDPLVPLLVPLADMSHFEILAAQRKSVGLDRGFIMTNANCAVTGLAVALYALEQRFGPVSEVCVTTLQAVSGAGYPGVPSLDIYDNVVPYIGGEEDKLETELQKILGGVCASGASALPHRSDMKVSATCTRVAVLDGHTEAVSVKFANATPSPEEAAECLRAFVSDAQKLGCPSAPPRCAIVVHDAIDRPQPRLDRDEQGGACVHVGRLRPCSIFGLKFVCACAQLGRADRAVLSSNTNIGAATSSVINAEYAYAKGFLG